jgi:hypothetical protein
MRKYPWRLKLVHEGHRFIRVERRGRFFAFEPNAAFHEVGLILGDSEARLRGLKATHANGVGEVVVSPELQSTLAEMSGLSVHACPAEVDGCQFESMAYVPHSQPDRQSGVLRMRRAFKSPRKAARRMMDSGDTPLAGSEAAILQITLPDGGRLLHLDLCLHEEADLSWIKTAQARFKGADWVICGVEYGQDAAVLQHLAGFEGQINLITDLVNEERSEQGLSFNILTPTVDTLLDQGLTAYPFPPLSSFRFET